ncbi:MAG: methanogenesis marker 3 protein [Methanoregulaceae archaeon]|nr:methanogenesis marker 3 protein [Methanoregulaceae archaeon]
MISVRRDGEEIRLEKGATLGTLLTGHDFSRVVAVIRPGARESATTQNLRLSTTEGEIVVENAGERTFPQIPVDHLAIRWEDRYAAAFGPFESDVLPARREHVYERGDMILGCGGYDPKQSFLLFSRLRHSADHGAGRDGGIIGRVVSGRGVLDRFIPGDRITAIAPVVSWADTTRSFTTNDRALVLEDGMEVISRIDITAQGYSPGEIETSGARTVEHFLYTLQSGRFSVARASSTHIRDELKEGTDLPVELTMPRREGTVTVRTRGKSRGSIYIYRADIPGSPHHSVVGQVTHGIEIAKLAREHDVFTVNITPERFDLVGSPLDKALAVAGERKILAKPDHAGSDRIVVGQDPGTTLEALAQESVSLTTAPLHEVIDIELDDSRAPQTCAVFRELTGLNVHLVGRIPLYFSFEDVFLFKPKVPAGVKIVPENTPEGEVQAGVLAMTNDARRGAGMVGVRTKPNREFGPTSEPFEGTNVIGRVRDLEKLGGFAEKETVYIREVHP